MKGFRKIILSVVLGLISFSLATSCSHSDDDVRIPDDILGVWTPSDNLYLEFAEQNIIRKLTIEFQDDESIGIWAKDVYYYEPGYNLVIYLTPAYHARVYQVVELTFTQMTWCWVYDIDVTGAESISKLLGDIINKAQEGFRLDPALYQYFSYVPEDTFLSILEELDIMYPW